MRWGKIRRRKRSFDVRRKSGGASRERRRRVERVSVRELYTSVKKDDKIYMCN